MRKVCLVKSNYVSRILSRHPSVLMPPYVFVFTLRLCYLLIDAIIFFDMNSKETEGDRCFIFNTTIKAVAVRYFKVPRLVTPFDVDHDL